MIRVCYVVDAPFLGGAERYVELLSGGLDAGEFAPSLLLRAGTPDPALTAWGERLGARGMPVRRVRMDLPFRPGDAWGIYRALEAFAPHVVHVNMPGPYDGQMGLAAVLGRVAGARGVVVTEHLPMVERLWKRALVKRWAYRFVDEVTTVCAANVDYLVGRHAVPARKVRVIVNALPADYATRGVDREATRRRHGVPRGAVAVAFVSNLLGHKGLDRLIRALSSIPDLPWHLVVAGAGPEEANCRALVSASGVDARASFLGRLEAPEVEALLASVDILALPSTVEGMPYVVLEAMASGLAVVVGRVAGLPEQVAEGETGFLVDPLDVPGLADALARLVSDAALRQRMGEAGRRRFRARFTLDAQVARMAAVYRRLARTQTGRRDEL